MATPSIILASTSPRRKELLKQAGIRYRTAAPQCEERPRSGESVRSMIRRFSWEKASDVASRLRSGIVIGADTMVLLEGMALGKPKSPKAAVAMLRKLSGKTHSVITACTIIDARTGKQKTFTQETRVTFRKLNDDEIRGYVATGEPMDKAGAYAVQGKGMPFVRGIRGDHANVIGLPVASLVKAIKEFHLK